MICIIIIIVLYLRERTFNVSMSAGVFAGVVIRNSLYQRRNKLDAPMRTSDGSTTGSLRWWLLCSANSSWNKLDKMNGRSNNRPYKWYLKYHLYGEVANFMADKVLTQHDVFPSDDHRTMSESIWAWLAITHKRVSWTCKFMLVKTLILIIECIPDYVIVSADILVVNTIASLLVSFPTPSKPGTDGMERVSPRKSHCLWLTNMTAIFTISSPICVV